MVNRPRDDREILASLRGEVYTPGDDGPANKPSVPTTASPDIDPSSETPPPFYKPTVWTPDALAATDFPPPAWLIPALLPEGGVVVLAGRPKVGKSWLSLWWASLIEPSIYIPFEDANETSVKARVVKLRIHSNPYIPLPPPPRCPEGIAALHSLCDTYNPRAIFIDPWVRFKPLTTSNHRPYETDYEHGADIEKFAAQRNVTVILVLHTRKRIVSSDGTDPFEEVLGTRGVVGGANTTIILNRPHLAKRGQLLLTSRRVPEYDKTVEFDGALWTVLGDAGEYASSEARAEIQDILRDAGRPLKAREIADETGKAVGTIRKLLCSMFKDDQVARPNQGLYTLPSGNAVTQVTEVEKLNDLLEF